MLWKKISVATSSTPCCTSARECPFDVLLGFAVLKNTLIREMSMQVHMSIGAFPMFQGAAQTDWG